MKFLKYFILPLIAGTLFIGCSSDDDNHWEEIDETDGLLHIKTLKKDGYTLDIFTENGKLTVGYNELFLQIRKNDHLLNDVQISWMPEMDMGNMEHGCPYSAVKKVPGKQSLYTGFIVFTMEGEWDIDIHFIHDGMHEMDFDPNVLATDHRNLNSFEGSDGEHYVLALIEPRDPEVKINEMTAGLFTMASMMDFPIANNYTIKIDPRMPSMGNHGSPNNENLTQGADGLYQGKLSLTMTGYWRINMILENQNGDIIKGEEVTETHEGSSLYFEIEF